jgi:putative mRNA 3-end processing factor
VFVTEATFGLPIFRHPPADGEIARLLRSVELFPERTHVVGCYALGKCQRVIALLREAGWDRPIHLHGALMGLCRLYEELGVPLGDLRPATVAERRRCAARWCWRRLGRRGPLGAAPGGAGGGDRLRLDAGAPAGAAARR